MLNLVRTGAMDFLGVIFPPLTPPLLLGARRDRWRSCTRRVGGASEIMPGVDGVPGL